LVVALYVIELARENVNWFIVSYDSANK